MRRKAIGAIALASLAGCVLLAMAWQANATAGGANSGTIAAVVNTARYLLFGGSYSVAGAQQPESAVFKIDSYTGDTWILKVETANGKRMERWAPIAGGAPGPAGDDPGRIPGGQQ